MSGEDVAYAICSVLLIGLGLLTAAIPRQLIGYDPRTRKRTPVPHTPEVDRQVLLARFMGVAVVLGAIFLLVTSL